MKLIGLTGGIATGKSTVARLLADKGIPVIDADQVSRELVRPGEPALDRIVERFGREILDEDGRLDRAAMRRRIMEDPKQRKDLEGILHPAIRQRIAEQIAAFALEGREATVVEAALMVETGSYRIYPYLIVVSAPPELQIERVMARDGVSEEDARAVLSAQLPLADKEAVATHVILNTGTEADLARAVDEVWSAIKGA